MTEENAGLAQLIEELKDESPTGEVSAAYSDAHVLVYVSDADCAKERPVKIDKESCDVLLSSVEAAERTVEALGLNEESHIVLVGITLPESVVSYLETSVATVDEQ